MQKWILVAAFIVSVALGAAIYDRLSGGFGGDGVEVTWDMLAQMDYITGKASGELAALDNHMVKVPGFMVPLEDSMKRVTEFLLVPTPQACIHVPPPPANQMVYIKMKGSGVDVAYGPIWVHGTLKLTTKKHMYGEASFEIDGDSIEAYR